MDAKIPRDLKAKKVAVFTEDAEGKIDIHLWKIIGTRDQIRKEQFREYIKSEVAKRGLELKLIVADGDPAAEQIQAKMLNYTETLWIHEWQSNAHRNPVLPAPVPSPQPLFELILGPFPTGQGIMYVDPDTKVKCFP